MSLLVKCSIYSTTEDPPALLLPCYQHHAICLESISLFLFPSRSLSLYLCVCVCDSSHVRVRLAEALAAVCLFDVEPC